MIKQFQNFSSILEKQMYFLSQQGPTLGIFANLENTNLIFIDFSNNNNMDNFSFCQKPSLIIKIPSSMENNIRIFYYYLLYICYENSQLNTSLAEEILLKFKKKIYREDMKFDLLSFKDKTSKYKDTFTNTKLKKLLVQFLQIMNYNKTKGSIAKMINKYPIIDQIFINFFRQEILLSKKQRSISVKQSINTKFLAQYFCDSFGFEVSFNNDVKEWIFENINGNNFAYKQEQQFSVFYNFKATKKHIIISQTSIKSREIQSSEYINDDKESDNFNSTQNIINQQNTLNQSFFDSDLLPIQSKLIEPKQIVGEALIENFSFGKKQETTPNIPKPFELKLQKDEESVKNQTQSDQFKRNRPIKQIHIQHGDILTIPILNKFKDPQDFEQQQQKQNEKILQSPRNKKNNITNRYDVSPNKKNTMEQKPRSSPKKQSNFQKKIIYKNKDSKNFQKQENLMTKSIMDFKTINNNIIIQKPLSSKGDANKSGLQNKQKLNPLKNSEKSIDFDADADSMEVKSSNTQPQREVNEQNRYELKKKSSFTTLAPKQHSSKSKAKTIYNYKLDKQISQDIEHYLTNSQKLSTQKITNIPSVKISNVSNQVQNTRIISNIPKIQNLKPNNTPLLVQNLHPKNQIHPPKITVNYFKQSSNPVVKKHPQNFNLHYYVPKPTNVTIKYSNPIIINNNNINNIHKTPENILNNNNKNIPNKNINSIFQNLCCAINDNKKQQIYISPKHSQFVTNNAKQFSKFRKLSEKI